jgi:hypothetical protein
MEGRGRSIEQVIFAKTVDQADCKKYSQNTLGQISRRDEALNPGRGWKVQSSECKTELTPRYAKLFDNEPASLTYLSIARGDRYEREVRLIYWGVTLEESDKVCDGVSQMQIGYKGTVRCIRAPRA